MELKSLRKTVDNIDKKIIQLLNVRAKTTLDIAELKRKGGKSIYSPDREREVLKKLAIINKGPLSSSALEAIYREIMSCSLSLDRPLRIAYLGPEATFTHLAALKRFGSQVEYIACNSITDVFLEVERDNADYGVVPIENSVEGAVSHTLDMFVDSELKICSQTILDVTHHLLANCSKNKIRRVYSNPQVFGQCRIWLQENLAGVETIEVSSTTRAAQIAVKEKYSACIAALLAAKVYKLKAVASDIEDSPHNVTRFLIIGKTDVPPTGLDRTSIMFSIKDKVGALHDMLLPFKKYRINLTKIESRPSKKKAWDYYFFVDLNGHQDNPRVKKALLELEDKCKFLKVLGSYPLGE
ncbi:MAG: prephenate dehydratase [Candidatus Omnitrophica bacterium CG23_combo_of_CG06-09_8_20_14_all_40_11]|nr:MAG: prephenate dehydratase [Candidatus Omnitrophica bacterium CG23_combo_of_CG06-09_8_20_14_all_40_11]